MSKFLSLILAVFTAVYSMFGWMIPAKAPSDDTDFTPVFRFIASSDSHVKAGFDTNSRRIQKMLRLGYAVADADDAQHYDEGQIAWLRTQLEEATAADPLKPVFVMHHEHVRNTVYGSSDFEGWGVTAFTDVLKDFPQVVDFSGHSHYPLNDPRSLWQGEFTAIGTGALYYTELTVDDVRTIHPDGYKKVATCWIVEADANNRLRLRGMDVLSQQVLCEYILENPADPANRTYTPQKRAEASKPPVFDAGASVKAKARSDELRVTVPAARSADGMPVVLYRAAAYDADGSEAASAWAIPRYYVTGTEKEITVTLPELPAGTYEVRAVAETAYGVQSAPLTTTVTVG